MHSRMFTPKNYAAVQLWERYCREAIDMDGNENLDFKGRFKAITTITNFSEVSS